MTPHCPGPPPAPGRAGPAGALALLAALLLAPAPLRAQALPAPAPTAPAPAAPARAAAPSPAPTDDARARAEAVRAELGPIEAALSRPDLSAAALTDLRARVEPLAARARAAADDLGPRVAGIKARLEQLGEKPEDAAAEGPEVAAQRAAEERALREADDLARAARALAVQAEQAAAAIDERRRALFARQLLARTQSVASPALWATVARDLPRDAAALRLLGEDWLGFARARLDAGGALLLGFGTLVLGLGLVPARALARRLRGRNPDAEAPTRLSRAAAALRVAAVSAVAPALACLAFHALLEALGVVPERAAPVLRALLVGIAGIAFVRGLADGVLGPGEPRWRLFPLDDTAAGSLAGLAVLVASLLALGRVGEAALSAVLASLSAVVLLKGLVATLIALAMMRALARLGDRAEADAADEACLGPRVDPPGSASALGLPLRLAGWAAAGAILLAALAGFVALATFLADQVAWVAVIGTLVALLGILADDALEANLRADGRLGRRLGSATGLSRGSLAQAAVLASGAARLGLLVAAGLLVLAPYGLDGADVAQTLRAALFGFEVGGLTLSLSGVLGAVALLGLVLLASRGVQGWLERRFLPTTRLDVGLRNSIVTVVGYAGFILAALLALGQLGLSIERLTLVAGALSVGIGFGLQSIVNNFVSGLILLWERPIRVGDWIALGAEEGIVKRINVRSTEIATFESASLIVPNSEFISGRVKNWVHADRVGRILLPFTVGGGQDPARVRAALLDLAGAHPAVLKEPAPRVLFTKMSDAALDFELRAYTDVDAMLTTKSDLLFAVHARFRADGLLVPPGPPVMQVPALDRIGDVLAARAAGLPRPVA